ncbi:MAG: hypothetical protein GY698_19825, partial [Actinomycetia bacterium]|nr:hypothetical protein [Actinomycetes bacterium]
PLQEQLRNYGPIFQNIGFDASETSVIMGQFAKAGIDISKVSPALNKFSRDVAAVGGDPMTALLDITQAINDAASTTDALNIASDAFGAEGAQRMVTAVRDAGVGFEDLQDALAGSEGGIALAAEQTATLGEKWREFTNKVLVQLEPVATRVFGFVMDAMDRLGPIAEQATAALAPFLEILGGSGSIGEKLSGLWAEAQPHLAEFRDRFVQWVKDITPPLLREAGRMATKFGRWIKDQAPEWSAQLVEWGKAFVEWVVPMIPPALEKLVAFATATADWMLETGLPLLAEKLVEWGKAFVEWVVPMIPPLLLELGKVLVSLGEWALTSAVPKIAALGVDLAGAMLGFITNDVLPSLPGLLADVLGAIVDWAT